MSDTLNDTTEHEHAAPGADEADGNAHGRHRGLTAPDDNTENDPHGRHRR